MKLEEFMQAHEGETGMVEKLNPKYLASQGVELSDEELDLATGGASAPLPPINHGTEIEECQWDEKERATHWREKGTNRVFYYACPKCKRVTHMGMFNFVYCDPCDAYWNTWAERKVYISW